MGYQIAMSGAPAAPVMVSLDYLFIPRQRGRRDDQAQGTGRLEIDDDSTSVD